MLRAATIFASSSTRHHESLLNHSELDYYSDNIQQPNGAGGGGTNNISFTRKLYEMLNDIRNKDIIIWHPGKFKRPPLYHPLMIFDVVWAGID